MEKRRTGAQTRNSKEIARARGSVTAKDNDRAGARSTQYGLDRPALTPYLPRLTRRPFSAENRVREEGDAPGARAPRAQPRPELRPAYRAEARSRCHDVPASR